MDLKDVYIIHNGYTDIIVIAIELKKSKREETNENNNADKTGAEREREGEAFLFRPNASARRSTLFCTSLYDGEDDSVHACAPFSFGEFTDVHSMAGRLKCLLAA